MPTVSAMEYKVAPVMSKGSVGDEAVHEVSRDRDPPLLGVLFNEANRSRCRCEIVLAQPDGAVPSTAGLSQEAEDEVVKFGIA
jgi:hypothetical protein